jgi:orotate phosphoribosyltransferase-like protein
MESESIMQEYAVYKGEKLIAIGTAQECASELNVSVEYIQWMTTPIAKKRLEKRKRPEKCTVAVKLEEE